MRKAFVLCLAASLLISAVAFASLPTAEVLVRQAGEESTGADMKFAPLRQTRESSAGDRQTPKDGEQSFAVILACADARATAESLFDQGLGDLFTGQSAGNASGDTALGSIACAVERLEAPLVVVVGVSECGAVAGACQGGEYPPACEGVVGADAVVHDSAAGMEQTIEVDEMVHETGTKMICAYYDMQTGELMCLDGSTR